MRAKASARSLVWVANLQIPARGGNRSSALLQGVWEMGPQFICSQILLLSSGPHQMGPNLHWECCNDIMPALAAATAGSVRVCRSVCVWFSRRKTVMEEEKETDDSLSTRFLIELQPRNAEEGNRPADFPPQLNDADGDGKTNVTQAVQPGASERPALCWCQSRPY